MYKLSQITSTICFDMETVPDKLWDELEEGKKKLWKEKYHYRFYSQEIENRKKKLALKKNESNTNFIKEEDVAASFEEIYIKYSPLIAEFGRIWCISFGLFLPSEVLDINTFQDENEKKMIEDFISLLNSYDLELSGYNISEFDIPYFLKRMWINEVALEYPKQLQLKDAKPWTTKHIDLMNDWKSISKDNVSLGVVCEALNIPTPKDKFNNDEFVGLLLSKSISEEEGIEYCEKDVKACMLCMKKLASENSNFAITTPIKTWVKK